MQFYLQVKFWAGWTGRILLEAWRKWQSHPKIEQPIELALPFSWLMLLCFRPCILKCSMQWLQIAERVAYLPFLTLTAMPYCQILFLRHLNWSLTYNNTKSNTHYHLLYSSLTLCLEVPTIILHSLGICVWYIFRSVILLLKSTEYLLAYQQNMI